METTLETESLILRPWRLEDIEQLVEGLNNMEVARWLAFVAHPYLRSDGLRWIEHCQRLSPDEGASPDYEFAIERKVGRDVIGGVSLNNIDASQGSAGGGMWIGVAHRLFRRERSVVGFAEAVRIQTHRCRAAAAPMPCGRILEGRDFDQLAQGGLGEKPGMSRRASVLESIPTSNS